MRMREEIKKFLTISGECSILNKILQKSKNPFIHFPFVALQIEELLKIVLDSDETMNSLVKELKDLINKMIIDEEFSENEANKENILNSKISSWRKLRKLP